MQSVMLIVSRAEVVPERTPFDTAGLADPAICFVGFGGGLFGPLLLQGDWSESG